MTSSCRLACLACLPPSGASLSSSSRLTERCRAKPPLGTSATGRTIGEETIFASCCSTADQCSCFILVVEERTAVFSLTLCYVLCSSLQQLRIRSSFVSIVVLGDFWSKFIVPEARVVLIPLCNPSCYKSCAVHVQLRPGVDGTLLLA